MAQVWLKLTGAKMVVSGPADARADCRRLFISKIPVSRNSCSWVWLRGAGSIPEFHEFSVARAPGGAVALLAVVMEWRKISRRRAVVALLVILVYP